MRLSTILVLVLIGFLVLNVSCEYHYFIYNVIKTIFIKKLIKIAKPCVLRKYPDGYVCVCNSTYCDTLEDVPNDLNGRFIVVSSSRVRSYNNYLQANTITF